MDPKQNHLAHESSLYLLQHENNPVDWYPWGPEALTKAKKENKPILLSIGYSACHWCHVIAHESFEDPEIAAFMNQHFVNIKVDREERPDLDKIYQLSYQLMNESGGGWPLTVFLSPEDHVPFFIGTYFPPTTSYGRISFKEVLMRIADVYEQKQQEIQTNKAQLLNVLKQIMEFSATDPNDQLTAAPIEAATNKLKQDFDHQYGGFGVAPKFPHPTYLQRLMRHYLWSKANKQEDKETLNIVMHTLTMMAKGGIYDQLGGGFFRYSVDRIWEIPHFEKMLYDNAQLLVVYAQAYALSKNKLFAQVIEETADWLIREMQAPEGSFYATLDADSDHVEGKYYYWDEQEIKALLTQDEFAVAAFYFGLDKETNFEKHWHLKQSINLEEVSKKLPLDFNSAEKSLTSARQKLLAARSKRTYPARNEKIITAWNGLAIKGLVYAGIYLQRNDYIATAQKALCFIKNNLWVNKRLYANVQSGKLGNKGYLDDYAFLLDSIMILLQAAWNTEDLIFAQQLADDLLDLFADKTNGGFFFTSHESEPLIVRPKSFMDEAVPAGSSSAAFSLSRIGWLLAENKYLHAVEHALKNAAQEMLVYSAAYSSLIDVLEEYLYPPEVIIIRADFEHGRAWLDAALAIFNPRRMAFLIPQEERSSLPHALQAKQALPGKVVAYVCVGQECLAPIENLDAFLQYLHNNK